jgi:predicted nucleic acid-binding Zn ribbon protein
VTSFDLLTNYIDDPEALLKRTKAKLKKVLALELEDKHIR